MSDVARTIDVPEVRTIVTPFTLEEIRDDNGSLRVVGHAAVFDRLSEDLGGFRERIMRGAFRKVLDANLDVPLLYNHDTNYILARTQNRTLELREDPVGLRIFAEMAPTTYANDVRVLLKRGDLRGMSFGFRVAPGGDNFAEVDGQTVRTISQFGDLTDVSIVATPAYPQTDVALRSICGIQIEDENGLNLDALRSLAWQVHRGEIEVTDEERSHIDTALGLTDTPPDPSQQVDGTPAQDTELRGEDQGNGDESGDAPSGEIDERQLAARTRQLKVRLREIE